MEEQLLMAYRVVEINHIVYIVVFPIPDQKEIEKKNFKYPDYIKGLLTKLKELSREERIKILNEWSAPKEIHPYDIALGRIQIAYEKDLHTKGSEEILPDIYTEQMKQVIEEYKRSYEIALALQQEEMLKKKFEEIKKTSQERFASFLEGTININGKEYQLLENYFPTINPQAPYELSESEAEVVKKLAKSFKNSEKLQRHIQFLYSKGSIYKIHNGNLLIHGCVPMSSLGNFVSVNVKGRNLSGRAYLDYVDKIAREGYFEDEGSEKREYGKDYLWYLWCGKNSPIFCKDKMKTFERYYLAEKEMWEEIKNPFYDFQNDERISEKILEDFGIDPKKGHIICGHIPVKFKTGESPIKANGKLLIIDGGLSKAYQKTTGIAGYTLRYSSYGLTIVAHEPFTSRESAIINETDLHSEIQIVEKVERKRIKDTDKGKELINQIKDLEKLLEAYKDGSISENN